MYVIAHNLADAPSVVTTEVRNRELGMCAGPTNRGRFDAIRVLRNETLESSSE